MSLRRHDSSYPSQQQQPPQPPSSSQQARDRDQSRDASHSTPPRVIGAPLNFSTGQFAGKHVRAELIELQKADLGRKYARKDRRPLDPPPVVQLKFFYAFPGTDTPDREVENYDEINNMGLICHVDLFPVPSSDSPDTPTDPKRRPDQAQASPGRASSSTLSPTPYSPGAQPYPYTYPAPQPPAPYPTAVQQQATTTAARWRATWSYIVHYFKGTYPINEGSRQTEALAGTTFVQAANLDYKGNKVLMFVFSDLAVKAEGNFILRYRCFDLFSRPVWAECYGGPFRVYSTKEFPGLRASTDLTKHLSYFGVRLNLRETERKRRRKVDDPSQSASAGSAGGASSGGARNDKRRGDDEGSGYDD
ncbi:velvet factor-domain-containing protein [Lactarius akahatsu]|uniref:Velvet factor-domain-containing protein n=1 Tax=Lactarius akahatsu TaxID=416441 RepID=A0AAD4LDM0_9AGAM|nr:velvet factor-domain-containing protein [Lactarius akahatsu]